MPGRRSNPPRLLRLVAASLIVAAGLRLAGCARNGEVLAGDDLARLAIQDGGLIFHPVFSPDGKSIAYSSRPDKGENVFGVYRVPVAGGPPEEIYCDSTGVYAIDWYAGGEELLVYTFDDFRVKRLSLSGEILGEIPSENLTEVMEVDASGKQLLVCTFTGDNCDVGVRRVEGGEIRYLSETPEWELFATFGPGPGEVTVVRTDTYGAATSEILVWSPETEAFRALPLQSGKHVSPSWSPNGALLAYCSDVAGSFDLWLYEAATERLVQLTSGDEDDMSPSWSPGGDALAFARHSRSSNVHVADSKTHAKRRLTEGDTRDQWAKASPDGKWVVFARLEKSESGGRDLDLCLVPTEGGPVRKLDLEDLRLASVDLQEFDWSPDSREIAFAADDGSGNVGIYRIPVEGGPPVQVTITPGMEMLPAWSPDGRMIAYTRISGETQVWTVPATGGLPTQLSANEGINVRPVWAGDSDRVAYFSQRLDEGFEVWITSFSEPDGQRRIAGSKTIIVPVAWTVAMDELIVLREEETTRLCALGTDGTGEHVVATQDPQLNAGHGFLFTAAGERYRSAYYAGELYAFTDGKQVSELYRLRVAGWTGDLKGRRVE